MKRTLFTALFFVALAAQPLARADDDGQPDFEVIVNSHNPLSTLDRRVLADIFFKKLTHWPEDGVVLPVDLRQDSPIRQKFSEEVLNRPVMGIKSYWQQAIFSGQDVPPPELRNDEEVIHYVSKNASAVGYVSSSSLSSTKNGVKVLAVR